MKPLRILACLPLLALAAACQPSGYYDQQGYYHAYSNGSEHSNAMTTGSTTIVDRDPSYHSYENRYDEMTPSAGNPGFTREGFYDHNGYYIAFEDGPPVPGSMMPPRGMCRVWFANRAVSAQPHVESCGGILARLPADAYVVYGG